MIPIPLDTPVTVTIADEYAGPAIVTGRSTAGDGRTVLSYRVLCADGERRTALPPEVSAYPAVVAVLLELANAGDRP
ncbi:hypothetical protein [Phaeospirillum tilakii]|uniref:Uncharacterized protein n=1 Tax=Phaeospirillum tilakii TaxID=741673 RepID=A0ABW5C8W1_9PROT